MNANPEPVPRRLAAILAADAVNFSGLVASDEERTLRELARHRAVIDAQIRAHDGRIVTTAGDSVLAEFASPVRAVRAALGIQRALAELPAADAHAHPLRFRIGINVGDIVVDGENILGDGVNVAVRLENIAQPGAILVSASVRDHVAGKIPEAMEDLGNQYLKNIPRPVRVFRVVSDPAGSGARSVAAVRTRIGRLVALASAVALVVAGGWWSQREAADGTRPAAAGAPATEDERAYWKSVSGSSDPAELDAFLKRYPDSPFRELARTRLDGLLAGGTRFEKNAEMSHKMAEAARAQAEAHRLKTEADAAIARASAEQATAMRLKAEADLAAARAAVAAKAAADAQQRMARGTSPVAGEERILLARSISPFDGRWSSDWNCEASAEQPSTTLRLPVLVQFREIRIETGQAGLPGYYRAYGRIGDDGGFDLKGISLPRTQRIVGVEQPLAASGRGESDRLEGQGTIGERRCAVVISRGSTQ